MLFYEKNILFRIPRPIDRASGPATFNEVFVQDGKVLGVPDTEKFADVRANGDRPGSRTFSRSSPLMPAR